MGTFDQQHQHPITPPPELRRLWAQQARRMDPWDSVAWLQHVSTQAARWGADQELEACCEILRGEFNYHHIAEPLRAARRPKPPSLQEQALAQLASLRADLRVHGIVPNTDIIRRALERLQELEEGNE